MERHLSSKAMVILMSSAIVMLIEHAVSMTLGYCVFVGWRIKKQQVVSRFTIEVAMPRGLCVILWARKYFIIIEYVEERSFSAALRQQIGYQHC